LAEGRVNGRRVIDVIAPGHACAKTGTRNGYYDAHARVQQILHTAPWGDEGVSEVWLRTKLH
jgi:hypothetical protein